MILEPHCRRPGVKPIGTMPALYEAFPVHCDGVLSLMAAHAYGDKPILVWDTEHEIWVEANILP